MEESWVMDMAIPPVSVSPVFLAGGGEDFDRMDDVKENDREEDDLMATHTDTCEDKMGESNHNEEWGQWKRALAGL